jgi:shikimate kinase
MHSLQAGRATGGSSAAAAARHAAAAVPRPLSAAPLALRRAVAPLAPALSVAPQQLYQQQHQQQQQQQQARRRRSAAALRATADNAAAAAASDNASAAPSSSADLDRRPFTVDEDFDLLSNEVKKLTDTLSTELRGCSLYLVGMMGSGKTTVGRMLANTLRYAFFDTDAVIEAAHGGKSVADIFRDSGEEYFRRCESQVLQELAPYKSLVVATGGGCVANPKNWSYMHNGIVAWLSGEPELLARRVVADGAAKRPLLSSSGAETEDENAANNATTSSVDASGEAYGAALARLSNLAEQRRKYYSNADVVVPLDGRTDEDRERGAPTAVVMHRLMAAVAERIEKTREEREARRNFTIEYASDADKPGAKAE